MFSWPRLRDADPVLRCEMASTGEVSLPETQSSNNLVILCFFSCYLILRVSVNTQLSVCFVVGSVFWTKHLLSLPEGDALHRLQAAAEGHPDWDSGKTTAIWKSTCLLFVLPFGASCPQDNKCEVPSEQMA